MPDTVDTGFGANPTPTVKSQPATFAQTENLSHCDQKVNPDAAGRSVVFEYCISLIGITMRRTSPPIYLRPGQWAWVHGLPYVGLSLLLGWWGLPWGVIYTPISVFANLTGGRDITAEVSEAARSDM